MKVNVIGAGLAGVEATWYLANKGYEVDLYEMRPVKMTPAHKGDKFAELICSNSLRASGLSNAVGLLKEEMKEFGSLVMESAIKNEVPAGGALAVDRENFSSYITEKIKNHKNVNIINKEVLEIPDGYTIIATGPLTSDAFSKKIQELIGEKDFYFFDAAAPIIEASSINYDIVYLKSRYDKGEAAYLNCPMTKEEFDNFYEELINAECAESHDFELKVFEGCMPFEVMAKRGKQTLLFGPMKPVGLEHNGKRPYAVVQLRQDDSKKTLYNIVGFQTHLKWGEQKRIINMIPGLENASIVRYGVMHKNTYINSPLALKRNYQLKKNPNIFFAGQITGVEGYVESAASGLVAGISMDRYIKGLEELYFPTTTMMGAMSNYITTASPTNFQPMNANFGILKDLDQRYDKKAKKEAYGLRGIEELRRFKEILDGRN